jgi:hypothetical protein
MERAKTRDFTGAVTRDGHGGVHARRRCGVTIDGMTPPPAGLCDRCVHRRDVVTATSRFVLCTRALGDPAYAKYPRLPVIRCPGFDAAPPDAPVAEPE